MTDLQIVAVHPDDTDHPGRFAAWHAAVLAAHRAETGEAAAVWAAAEIAVTLADPTPSRRSEAWAGLVDGEVVTTGMLGLALLDDVHGAAVDVATAPEHRRRGYASAMLAHLEQRCLAEGRVRLDAESAWPVAAGPDPTGTPGHDFAVRHGFRFGLGDVQRELRGRVPEARLGELASRAAAHHAAYSLWVWNGPVPDELVDGWLALDATLMSQAPTGTLERVDASTDVVAHRAGEAHQRKQGRTTFNAVALDASGVVVAYSQLVTTVHEPGRAYQWGTLVHRDHRGHRLGLAVKVANHRLLLAAAPKVTRVTTWNAEENGPMIAVNEALGFETVARLAEMQKRLN